jgi:hypothetical protein
MANSCMCLVPEGCLIGVVMEQLLSSSHAAPMLFDQQLGIGT